MASLKQLATRRCGDSVHFLYVFKSCTSSCQVRRGAPRSPALLHPGGLRPSSRVQTGTMNPKGSVVVASGFKVVVGSQAAVRQC